MFVVRFLSSVWPSVTSTGHRPPDTQGGFVWAWCCVPAGLIAWVRDDDELGVGNDGRPLLLPYFLGKAHTPAGRKQRKLLQDEELEKG